jgi:hypothetical protein
MDHGSVSLTTYEKNLQSALSRYDQLRYMWLSMSWMDNLESTFDDGYNPLDCMACIQASGSTDPSKVTSQIHFDGFMKSKLNGFAKNTNPALLPSPFVSDEDLRRFSEIRDRVELRVVVAVQVVRHSFYSLDVSSTPLICHF